MKGHSQNSLVVNMGIVFFLAVASFHLPFCVSTGKCTLENGRAVPLGSQGTFNFTCNDGYYLSGQSITFCYLKPHCFYKLWYSSVCSGKFHPCTYFDVDDACYCDSDAVPNSLQCIRRTWTSKSCPKGCSSLHWPSSGRITYDSNMMDSLYPINTLATYQCLTVGNSFKPVRRCTSSGWSPSGSDVSCTCKGLESNTDITNIDYSWSSPQSDSGASPAYPIGTTVMYCEGTKPARRRGEKCTIYGWRDTSSNGECSCKGLESNTDITNIDYSRSSPQSDSGASPAYPIGTTVMYCEGTKPARRRGKRCTIYGWRDVSSNGECRRPTLRQPETPSTTRHKEDERTLIIVSGTTGAILGALIILVIIVSCQRRIRYHRMMRARARCRQDQDAFAAFITYHRDIRFMLPSYDEAVNQQDQGQPPTFDEAVADTDRPSPNDPSSTEPEESQSPDSPNSIPTESESVVINTSDAEQALVPSVAEGRFFRGLRMLFGGQEFTTRGVYCHLVPQPDEDQNECPDNEAASLSDDAVTDFNEALSRAGLC